MVDRKVYVPEAPPSSRGKCMDETIQARYVVHVMTIWPGAAENLKLNGMEVLGRTSSFTVAQSSRRYAGTRSGRHCGLGQLKVAEFESGRVGLV